jgi:hypothetical protein
VATKPPQFSEEAIRDMVEIFTEPRPAPPWVFWDGEWWKLVDDEYVIADPGEEP